MPYKPTVICCTKCDTHKPVEEFYGVLTFCKSCHKEHMKQYNAKKKIQALLSEVLTAA